MSMHDCEPLTMMGKHERNTKMTNRVDIVNEKCIRYFIWGQEQS